VRELAEPSVDGQAWEFLRQADLIFAVYGQYYDLLQYLPRLAGTGPRIVFDYLGVTPPRFWRDQHRDDLEKASQMRGYVWCADHALTISSANRRELLDATNFPEDHVKTLPIAVDVERFRPGANGRFLQRKLGIDGRALLYVGRLACNKRVPLLIEALALLARSTSEEPVHVVIVGDCRDVYAEEAARCVALAKELGIERRVHFVGELDDAELPLAYQSADALVMPSLHEGFCVPVIEAMAAGCPVIAARTSALPETAGDAGLTFTPDDADDLASQIRRVLDPAPLRPSVAPYRIAVVSFRFGPDIVGGAETSLRTMASALQQAGHHVEVFTTCTTTESNWANELSPGTMTLAGLKVHRFPIDPHDHAEHGEIVRAILDSHGNVAPALDDRYLHLSIHSAGLVEALRARQAEYDAILTGPYLFGLSADIAREFPRQTLIVPCFHDEPLAHLLIWPRLYGNAAGIMYHTMEEQQLAQGKFGVNHPNSTVIGTFIAPRDNSLAPLPEVLRRPYIVYCGRYSLQKNVPLLLEWVERYQKSHPSQLDVVFMGQGDLQLPSAPWLHDLGRVDEITKRSVLKNAAALVQLSRQESLSLVAREAWAEKTPIIAIAPFSSARSNALAAGPSLAPLANSPRFSIIGWPTKPQGAGSAPMAMRMWSRITFPRMHTPIESRNALPACRRLCTSKCANAAWNGQAASRGHAGKDDLLTSSSKCSRSRPGLAEVMCSLNRFGPARERRPSGRCSCRFGCRIVARMRRRRMDPAERWFVSKLDRRRAARWCCPVRRRGCRPW
jgi:glycosyltransferase involved in cell wall biosynthesis